MNAKLNINNNVKKKLNFEKWLYILTKKNYTFTKTQLNEQKNIKISRTHKIKNKI